MDNHDETNNVNSHNVKTKKQLIFPIAALVFSIASVLIMLLRFIPFDGFTFFYISFFVYLGIIFSIIGIMTGIVYIVSRIATLFAFFAPPTEDPIKPLKIKLKFSSLFFSFALIQYYCEGNDSRNEGL